ncbi:MAG: DUF4259 domain-containing protein, partial [Alphaproteobacteria bacterium]
MGAWSHTSFGNDDASDFIYEVEEDGQAAVLNAFEVIEHLKPDDYLESPDAAVALAAAELVAAANGKPPADFPETAAAVMAKVTSDPAVRQRATASVRRVLDYSELRELWLE